VTQKKLTKTPKKFFRLPFFRLMELTIIDRPSKHPVSVISASTKFALSRPGKVN